MSFPHGSGPSSYSDGAPSYGDGAPRRALRPLVAPETTPHPPGRTSPRGVASRLRRVEGPRGYSLRTSVALRYATYLVVLVACCALTQGALDGAPRADGGGRWMFLSSAVMLLSASVGTGFYPNHRNEIIEQVRHFVFGIAVLPGTGLAIIMWAAESFLSSPGATSDPFASTLEVALPIIFFCTVIIPCLVFIKVIAGIRHLHRSRLDDEEMMALYTRQDGHQR